MNRKLYFIENCGCDDVTRGLVRLSEDEFVRFKEIVENLNKNSNYCCMPTIEVYEIEESELKEVDINNLSTDCWEDNYVDKNYILYLEDKAYTLVRGNRYMLNLKQVI